MTAEDAYAEELGERTTDELWEMYATERNPKALALIERELSDFRGEVINSSRKRKEMKLPCHYCGSIDTEENRNHLWDLYHRVDDGGRKHIEPLVYTSRDFEDMGYYDGGPLDDEDYDAVKLSMERNMAERGLCPECGLPDLRGYGPEDFMTEEDANALADMYAEMAAERRAGC